MFDLAKAVWTVNVQFHESLHYLKKWLYLWKKCEKKNKNRSKTYLTHIG